MKRIFGLFLACAMILCAGCAGKKEVKSIQLNPEANKVLIGTNTDIAIVTDPENVQLADSDFTVSKGGNIEVGKNSAEFSASQPGKYSITVKKDGITSNTIIITVVQEQSELAKSDILDAKSETDTNTTQSKTDSSDVSENTASSQAESSPAASPARDADTTTENTNRQQTKNDDQDNSQPYIPPKADENALSASDLTASPDKYAGKTVTVVGTLNDSGTSLDGLKLTGYPVSISSVPAQLTGTFEKQADGSYALDVTSFAQVQ